MKGHFKKALLIASSNFFCWRKDYRVWMVFIVEGLLVVRNLTGLTRYALDTGKKATPFLLSVLFTDNTIANGLIKVLIYFGLIVLLCNAPFRDKRMHYLVIRTGKHAWWLGECLYILGASLIYVLFLMLACALTVLPVVTFQPYWGDAVNSLLNEDLSVLKVYFDHTLFPKDIIQVIYPIAAEGMTALMAWLTFAGLGMLIFLINDLTGRLMLGSLAAAFFVMLDPIMRWFGWAKARFWMYYLSPISWSSIEHWDILGSNHPLHGQTVAGLSAAILLALLAVTRLESVRREVSNH